MHFKLNNQLFISFIKLHIDSTYTFKRKTTQFAESLSRPNWMHAAQISGASAEFSRKHTRIYEKYIKKQPPPVPENPEDGKPPFPEKETRNKAR